MRNFFASAFALFAPSRLCLIFLCLAGCFAHNRPVQEHILYTGPTKSLSEVVSLINANNQRITTLWASGDFDIWMKDDKDHLQHIDGDKLLLAFRKPHDLKMAGEKFGIGRIFEIGSNANQYWLWIPYNIDTMWWGDYSSSSASSAELAGIPIRPDLLADVLGVDTINPDLHHQPLPDQPLPVMRFNNDRDVYMITFLVSLPDRVIVQKEVWYDRVTLMPTLIAFYDPNGRMILRAYPQQYQHLDNDPAGPMIPTYYDLYFLQSGTKLVFKLHDVKSSYKGIPNDATFRFPGLDRAAKTIQIDDHSQNQ